MEDGRKIIDETYQVIKGIADGLDEKKQNYSEEVFSGLEQDINDSLNWAKKCRNKVWLRSKEGTDLATGCLEAAKQLQENLENTNAAADAASSLLLKLEALAKIIATKASVMT